MLTPYNHNGDHARRSRAVIELPLFGENQARTAAEFRRRKAGASPLCARCSVAW